ncbi:unnamed protein product [Owenia fusiformis]|uniref:Uncharacterized protein n=1 Tax=Owenia fusiformis TaxID=6347 RepID=A0A8S4NPG3_OWEFU|nr:unnamed protein product [Owenia fusiformis]
MLTASGYSLKCDSTCCYGDEDIAELLLSNGANVNFKNAWNATPLFGAVDNNKLNTVRLLIKYGAMLNLQNDNGDTVLHIAAYRGFCDIVRLLLRHGAPSTVRNNCGKNCLNEAESRGHVEIAKILRHYTENIGQTSHDGPQMQTTSRQQNHRKLNVLPQTRDAPNLRTTSSLLQTRHPRNVVREEMTSLETNHCEFGTHIKRDIDSNHCSRYSPVQLEESPRHKWTHSANADEEYSGFRTLENSNWNIPPQTSTSLRPHIDNAPIDSNFNSISSSEKNAFYSNKDIFG